MLLKNYISNTFRQSLLAFVLTVFCTVIAVGQAVDGWEKHYLLGQLTTAYDCIQTKDEGFITVGEHEFGDAYIIRTNQDGLVRWNKQYDLDPNQAFGFKAIAETNDGYLAAGFAENFAFGGKDMFVAKFDDLGDTLWTRIIGYGFDDEANDIVATSDGGFAMVGYSTPGNNSSDPTDLYLVKMNSEGDTLWTRRYGNPDHDDEGNAIIELPNGDLVITGYTELNSQALLARTNADGDLIWFNGVPGANIGNDIIQTDDDGFLIAAATNINSTAVTIRIDQNGLFDGANSFNEGFDFQSVTKTRDGMYVFAGSLEPSATNSQGYLVKTNDLGLPDPNGWEKTFGKDEDFKNESFFGVTATADGGIFVVGNSTIDVNTFDYSYYLLKTNRAGNIYSNYITGNVFFDVDGNNIFTLGDEPIEGWIVEAISEEHTCFGTSEPDGSYSILVDTGMYDIIVRKPNDYWNAPSTIGFNIQNPGDTFDINFAVQDLEVCTDLEVDISTSALVPGEESEYRLLLCNDGTTTAIDPYIEVTIDEDFSFNGVIGAAFSLNGNLLTIDPQIDLAPFACHEVIINATLNAGLVEGETHSMFAHAYPDEICSGGGDGSHLEVRAECVGDDVNLIITNTGTQAMSAATDFIVIEDFAMLNIPQQVGPLEPNEELIIPRTANGSTYRICANQTPGHSGDSRPTAAIEGCVAGGGSFSTGFVNQFSEDDYDHFLSVDCQENVNALSPNESRGYPKGYNSATDSQIKNEISPCIDLKYIHRFQNTGPDTAIRVVIQDTLSRFLDPASVRPGASSHDYRMEVYGCGILRFTFDNIFLPGSSTDPQASQVFVKYRVSQRPSNPAGAIVDNSAAAYFDYKASVHTDSIYHTIADDCPKENYVDIDSTSHAIYLDAVEDVNIFPNPFQDEMTVEIISEVSLNNANFIVYDLRGRLVRKEAFTGKTFTFNRHNMTSGMYVYLIETEGQMVSTGKIIVQ